MEDGWVLAKALELCGNNLNEALPIFNQIRLPYYSRMYTHLETEAKHKSLTLSRLPSPTDDDRVRVKIIKSGGGDMQWIYGNDIEKVWTESMKSVVVSA